MPTPSGVGRYRPSNITPHIASQERFCWSCGTKYPLSEVTEKHPVPGLTVWQCRRGKCLGRPLQNGGKEVTAT
jgi:hypothetical protein